MFDFAQSLSGPIWTVGYADGDNFLAEQRRLGRAQSTRASKAGMIAQFYDFLIARNLGEIRARDRDRGRAADRRVEPALRGIAGQGARAALGCRGHRVLRALAAVDR